MTLARPLQMNSVMRRILFLIAFVAGCASDPGSEVEVCHFASGRPCPADQLCLGEKGGECQYLSCVQGEIVSGGAVACVAGTTDPQATGAPFNCDPATVPRDPEAESAFTPPNGPCPIGSLYALDPARALPYLFCVPVAQCAPIACDPGFAGDGCPADYGCDGATRTCVAP